MLQRRLDHAALVEDGMRERLDVGAVDVRVAIDVVPPAGGPLTGRYVADERGVISCAHPSVAVGVAAQDSAG